MCPGPVHAEAGASSFASDERLFPMIQTEEIRLTHMVRRWLRPLAATALLGMAAACGGDNGGAAAGQGKDGKAGAAPGAQKGAQAQPAQNQPAPVRTAYGKTAAESQ